MLFRYFWYICCILFPLTHLSAQAQAIILADSTTILIGDPLEVRIVVNVPHGAEVAFPTVRDALPKDAVVEILELSEQKKTKRKVNDTHEQTLLLTAWEPGQRELPALTFSYKQQENVYTITSKAFTFTASAPQVTGDSTYTADIKNILVEEPNFWDKCYQLLSHPITAVIFFLLLVFLAFYGLLVYRQKRKKASNIPSPEQWALEQLRQLEAQNYLTEGNFIAYHKGISIILRTYFHRRFAIDALEQPNSYFLPKVKQHPFLQNTPLREELATVLQQADLIKYAKASPLPIANEKAANAIKDVVALVRVQLEEAAKQEQQATRSPKSVG